jgi:DNA-binding FrmR family transcriptional regulator
MKERKEVSDRQLEALLARLDRIADEMHALNRRLDRGDDLQRIARELSTLNESLGALAYAALGHRGPDIRRRRAG